MMVIIGPYGVPQVITYQEPYEYYICTVKLKNKDLSHLPVEVLTEEQLSAYSLYMRTLGNRPDLFGQAQYPNASTIKQPTYYDIPPEALKDDKFAAMMEEATKYISEAEYDSLPWEWEKAGDPRWEVELIRRMAYGEGDLSVIAKGTLAMMESSACPRAGWTATMVPPTPT